AASGLSRDAVAVLCARTPVILPVQNRAPARHRGRSLARCGRPALAPKEQGQKSARPRCWAASATFAGAVAAVAVAVAGSIRPRRQPAQRPCSVGRLRAGFSLHGDLDLDFTLPDEALLALPPLLLLAAGVRGMSALKSAVDGPPEFRLQPGSMRGRMVVITGGTAGGIGFEAAVRLAEAGATVVATARTAERAAAVEEALRAESGSADVHVLALDLADLSSVRAFVEEYQRQPWSQGIDVLLNNAGVMAVPQHTNTVDGFESQMGINHLGHFALTGLLLPLLGGASGQARVISVTSLAHRLADAEQLIPTLDAELDLPSIEEEYSPWAVYGLSKLANVVFAKELQRRLAAAGLQASAVSLHPGICATELARYVVSGKDVPMEDIYAGFAPPVQGLMQAMKGLLRPVNRGANSHVFLAAGADGSYDCSGGVYFQDMLPAEAHERADDPELGARLWEVSERLTGVTFDFASAVNLRDRASRDFKVKEASG
ncbi:unnamed protein product, partial [Polarella glacialis]